jgi:signal transduction histidine kinase
MSQSEKNGFAELSDRLALFLSSFGLSFLLFPGREQVLPLLLAVIVFSIMVYLEPGAWRRSLPPLFCLLCFFLPTLCVYLPLLVYETLESEPSWLISVLLTPVVLLFLKTGPGPTLLLACLTIVSALLKLRAVQGEKRQNELYSLQDRLRHLGKQILSQEQDQYERRENEIRLATLHERNRIARDIHDNVGHLLSSALLQTAALLASCVESAMKQPLAKLETTLKQGLDRIRHSVHHLHDTPIDIEAEINGLLQDVGDRRTEKNIDLQTIPERRLRHCLLAVIREALSNVIRHSDATELQLNLKEHPAFYQLTVSDNGRVKQLNLNEGLGLRSIRERVGELGGRVHFSSEDGFRLFVSLPKEKIQ